MRSPLRFAILLLWSLLLPASMFAQDLPEPMSPRRLVNDFAGLLSEQQRQALEQKLADFDRETSTQIAVVTVDDLQGYDPADFAQRLHDKWGIGQEGKNNGILVLVKPSTPGSSGQAYISVGYGLEGVIPDITAGRILDNEMIPRFRENDLYGGIDQATTVLMQLTRGEFTADNYNKRNDDGADFAVLFVLIPLIVFIIVAASRRGGKGGGSGNGSRGGGWIPPIILGGGGRSGGGSFGRGGFGGFGGGLSGGGGAGRSW